MRRLLSKPGAEAALPGPRQWDAKRMAAWVITVQYIGTVANLRQPSTHGSPLSLTELAREALNQVLAEVREDLSAAANTNSTRATSSLIAPSNNTGVANGSWHGSPAFGPSVRHPRSSPHASPGSRKGGSQSNTPTSIRPSNVVYSPNSSRASYESNGSIIYPAASGWVSPNRRTAARLLAPTTLPLHTSLPFTRSKDVDVYDMSTTPPRLCRCTTHNRMGAGSGKGYPSGSTMAPQLRGQPSSHLPVPSDLEPCPGGDADYPSPSRRLVLPFG